MMGMGTGMHGVSTLLISAAAGYWVLTLAVHQKKNLKKIGQFVGFVIIGASLLSVACKAYSQLSSCSTGKGFMGMTCPFTGKSASPAPTK